MATQPKISIITITYNSERTLEETIRSVISQDYPNLEYLIIDGASTDGTLNIVERYRKSIAYVSSEPDKGISDAFNKGIRHATGEIIGIINSDDLLLPGALNAIAENYDPKVDVYRGNTVIWDDTKDNRLSIKPTMRFPLGKPIKAVCHQSTFVTKRAYEKWGAYKLDFKYMMDADLLHRFYMQGATFKYISQDLAAFRLGGMTSDSWKKKLRERKLLVTGNGGSNLLGDIMCLKFSCLQICKSIGYKMLGGALTRKLRYHF